MLEYAVEFWGRCFLLLANNSYRFKLKSMNIHKTKFVLLTERMLALFANDERISRVNAGFGRSMKSSSLTYDSTGKTSSVRRNFLFLKSRLNYAVL